MIFDARSSYDPGTDIASYEWDWAYGATFSPDASGITATHAYADNGTYALALRVTDDDGASDVDTTTITIANVDPVVDAGPDQNVDEGTAASFTGTFTDTTADTHAILWSFGDGDSISGTLAPTHTYAEPGNPAVTLTITDDDGGVGSDVLAVTVQNLEPTADAGGPYTGTAGASVILTATGSDPGGGPLTYTWDLDDDGQYDDGNGEVVGYTWTVAGPHTATVQVVDAQQAAATDTAGVSISPAELSAIVLSPPTSTILAGQAQAYTVEAFDEYGNSRGDVTAQTEFSIVESGHGGNWSGNVYTSANHGDWTVQAIHTGTRVTTDTASLTILAPVLHLDKRGDPESVEAGAFLTYTLTYSNTGNQAATGVVLTDVLPPHVSYVTATLEPDGGLPDAPFWTIDNLSESVPGEIVLTVAVTSPLTNGTRLTNIAWLDADQTAPLSATLETSVTSRPLLTITKVDSTDPITEGHGLAYTIIITNGGNENGTGVTVVEDYDPNISISSTDPPADPGSQDRVWTFDTLPAGSLKRISVYAQVHAPLPVGTVLTNRVTLDSDQTDPIAATEATSVTSVSDLTIFQIDNPDPVEAGEELVYFITYWNSGEVAAYNVVITETYDSRVEFVSAEPAPIRGDNVWNIGTLPKHAGGNILITTRVDTPLPNSTVLTSRGTIDSLGTLPKSYTQTTTVSATADLAFTVTDYPDPVEPGSPLTYTLRYTNAGNADATGVVVTATLDSNVSLSDATPAGTGGGDGVWYWYLDDIAGEGGHGEIIVETTVTLPLTNGLKLDFGAQLGYAEGDPVSVTAQTTVSSAPVLSLQKGDGVDTVYAGDQLTYTLTYANSGRENAYDVTITDTLPNYVDYVACYGDCHRVPPSPGGNEAVVFHVPAITQTSGQVRLVVEVQDPLPAGADSVTNIARMTHPSLAAPIVVQDVDPIRTKPDLRIEAQHSSVLYSPGKTMVYTLTYGNAGQHMHTEDVVITTVMPTIIKHVDHGLGWQSSDGQTYTYAVGDLLAGSSGHTISFTVVYTNTPCLGVHAFTTTFAIAESRGAGRDAFPDDNIAAVWPGVPDLAVLDFSVDPLPPEPGEPVTFTVVLENQGTAVAQNPTPTGAGFWVDVFIAPAPSCPWERYSEKNIFAEVPPLPPGAQHILTIPYTFTQQEIRNEIQAFFVKVDNYAEPVYDHGGRIIGWTDLWGLVPESNEMNNLGGPIHPGIYRGYLPLAMKD
ncbi:MAG: DUF11 domain-containing protein [Anaerolineae bacterium]|nr:DUF11 domain-containing protein [Anaerolineae bacterium]